MSRTLQWVLGISAAVVALAVVLVLVMPWIAAWFGWGGGYGMMGPLGMMAGRYGTSGGYGSGMMGGYGGGVDGYGTGMMGGSGSGMMGGYGSGMMGGYGGGMMPWAAPSLEGTGERLTLEQAVVVAEEYAASFSTELTVPEVMEFEDNFYAILAEAETGRGAMEILIDPYRGFVGPEPGPNMMWNEKYGHMAWGSAEDSIGEDEARDLAQAWLDTALPGSRVHEHGMAFYGYHTFDFDGTDGAIAGMLSIDADTGATWLHTWHGRFLAEWEADEAAS